MYNNIKYIILIHLFGFVFSSAIIKGIVTDSETDAPLIGANIIIENTDQGGASDINGAYLISDIRSCSTCTYNIKVLYIGYEEHTSSILIDQNKDYVLDLSVNPSSLEVETTTVTAKKRQDKITDAPAAIELVSASDIKREESTNLGSYLKGLKGVDFTASGVNNYSISVRGFNSSFTSRLLTLTDGRVANIPALRVINYSTVPQSPKDIESIEVVLGPSTALYGANAHSGVVNITSKSPAVSEGLDISISGSAADERDLYKFSSRWAHKLSDKLSFKLSGEYIQAYEWEFISEEEYKAHKYAWSGQPARMIDGKDNNPWGFTTHIWGEKGIKQTIYHNYTDFDGNGHPDDSGYNMYLNNESDCRIGENYVCEEKWRYVGDGEQNDTGDPDNDGFMGEDWYNGYDDDNDGLIDEDYFYADGIDNDGDCPGDTNGDGIVCGSGDENVDEDIDWTSDQWIDGVDNNGNGQVDEIEERYGNNPSKLNFPDWQYDLEERDIIIYDGRIEETYFDKYDNPYPNPWYLGYDGDDHVRGTHIYDEENTELLFDVFIYDFGDDKLAGDLFGEGFGDEYGDQNFTPTEGFNTLTADIFTDNEYGFIAQEDCMNINNGVYHPFLGSCGDGIDDEYGFVTYDIPTESFLELEYQPDPNEDNYNPFPPNGVFGDGVGTNGIWEGGFGDDTDIFSLTADDCGLDGVCYDDPSLQDFGEGDGIWNNFDWNENGTLDIGDPWVDNGDNIFDPSLCNEYGICGDDTINDIYPGPNGIVDPWEIHADCGQDGICYDNQALWDYGEGDGVSRLFDSNGSELNNKFDLGDGLYGAPAEIFIDTNGNGYYDCNTPADPGNCDSFDPSNDVNGDGVWTQADYKDEMHNVYDINGDGYNDYPDFEVKNTRTEFRLDYDPSNDLNMTFQTGYALTKTQQVAGIGRYLADNYEYTYYQLRGRYKNWFSQLYFNQGNSGQTRGYLLGDMILDQSRNLAFQLQNNLNFRNTQLVWGVDYFRTEAMTNGTILNDGPNGYDNDGDVWFTSKDDIDTDGDSDDFSDWGIDGIGPYSTTADGDLEVDRTNNWEEIVNCNHNNSQYNAEFDFCYIDEDDNGTWTHYDNNDVWPYLPNENYTGADTGEGNGIPDPGEPGVNDNGDIYVDYLDNDGDGLDFDGDNYPNYQEIQLNTNPYDPNDYPSAVAIESFAEGYDELIDEDWCGSVQYEPYVPDNEYSGNRNGKYWRCSEGIDEPDEYSQIISNEMGFYFQTKTIPKKNKKFEIITAARFDHHDQLDEGIQFAPKFGIFYKPTNLQTFRLTYGKAYNTPSALTMATDLFVGKRGIVDYYLRGNKNGTEYLRVGDEVSTSTPQMYIPDDPFTEEINESGLYSIINITAAGSGSGSSNYWDGYKERVQGSPYFLGFNTEFSDVPEFMPLDTALYTVWVPELADTGRIYTATEAINISNISPIKTEKIQTLEIGFKGFISERIHATLDFYTSFYEDFFSAPTVITPLIIRRQFSENQDITSFDNLEIVGMLPATYDGGNAPFGTQWDGLDNDNDWDCSVRLSDEDTDCFLYGIEDSNGFQIGYLEDQEDTSPEYKNLKELFGWDGQEIDIYDDDGNFLYKQCIGCEGEWGYVEFFIEGSDTTGFTIHQPWDIIDVNGVINTGGISFIDQEAAKDYVAVGVDEYSALNGLSEAEMVVSPIKDANGNNIVAPGFAYTPLHSVLAPMNYGEIWMQGLDLGLTYLIPESKIALDANFSFYNTTEYYNVLTRKNDPINAPKFKMNASINWQSPIGNISIKYRHVDQFAWKDGIWAGTIGPYDLIDIHYNYRISKHLEFNITGLNIFDDRHKEMIGGAVMGRQIILRMSTSL